jgi:hypothetical protein
MKSIDKYLFPNMGKFRGNSDPPNHIMVIGSIPTQSIFNFQSEIKISIFISRKGGVFSPGWLVSSQFTSNKKTNITNTNIALL